MRGMQLVQTNIITGGFVKSLKLGKFGHLRAVLRDAGPHRLLPLHLSEVVRCAKNTSIQ